MKFFGDSRIIVGFSQIFGKIFVKFVNFFKKTIEIYLKIIYNIVQYEQNGYPPFFILP